MSDEHIWLLRTLRDSAHSYYGPALDAAIAALGGGWLPIESAPRDSHARLVYVPMNKCIFCVFWREPYDAQDAEMTPPGWYFFGGIGGRLTMEPSHYADLPAPPSKEG